MTRNQAVLESFIDRTNPNDPVLRMEAISEVALRKFQPLTRTELKGLRGVMSEGRGLQVLSYLADHACITLDEANIYPKTLYALSHYTRLVKVVPWYSSMVIDARNLLGSLIRPAAVAATGPVARPVVLAPWELFKGLVFQK